MIEDMTHLQILDALQREIFDLLANFNARASGQTDKGYLVELRLEQNQNIVELLRQQNRALRHMIGEAVPPEAHEANAVLLGIGGGTAA